jgi:hypothetical protein
MLFAKQEGQPVTNGNLRLWHYGKGIKFYAPATTGVYNRREWFETIPYKQPHTLPAVILMKEGGKGRGSLWQMEI